jgi:hypothetical protein
LPKANISIDIAFRTPSATNNACGIAPIKIEYAGKKIQCIDDHR